MNFPVHSALPRGTLALKITSRLAVVGDLAPSNARRSFSTEVLIALAEFGSELAAGGSLGARLAAALRTLERIGAGRSVIYSARAETRSLTVVSNGSVIEESDLPVVLRTPVMAGARLPLQAAVERLERQLIEDALEAADGSVVAAAHALQTTVRVVRYKIRKLGIDRDQIRS